MVVAALSLFAAVTTGWAERQSGPAAVAVPQPSASAEGAYAGANVAHLQAGDHAQPASQLPQGYSPTHQNSVKDAWMTKDRPATWMPLSPQSVWSPLPPSLVTSGVPPGDAHATATAAAIGDRDLLSHLCVARL